MGFNNGNNIGLNTQLSFLNDQNFNNQKDKNGPNAARNMGFPNMKYLDPDSKGDPIQEKTFYKQYLLNNDEI